MEHYSPKKEAEKGVVRTSEYWECVCGKYYVHPKSEEGCNRCGAPAKEMPDARVDALKIPDAMACNREMEKEYNLPNNEITTDFDVYAKAWEGLIQPILDATGYKLMAINPGFQIRSEDWHTVTLSIDFVEKINAALKGN